jgi:hypothetical protein
MRSVFSASLTRDLRRAARSLVLLGRGLLYVGGRHRCPCCHWSVRGFVGRWGWFTTQTNGYCPRCNAKARHRRLWLYLTKHTNLQVAKLKLLEIAPWWSVARQLLKMDNIQFIGLDIVNQGSQVTLIADAIAMPLAAKSVDAALCIHTLEHIESDHLAIAELYRVLKPGGWAIVSVPIRLDRPTYEDPTITDPEHRVQAFGERSHVRWYGSDFKDRLKIAGFDVQLDLGEQLPEHTRIRYGLRIDENLFHCIKPLTD